MTPKEEALDNLARAARAAQTWANSESWSTLDALRYFALQYAATEIRLSDDNPDLARGGSVAAFLEQRAEVLRMSSGQKLSGGASFRKLGANEDCHLTRETFITAVEMNAFIDYDGFGELATATEVSNVSISPSMVSGYQWPEWATHVVWYNK